MAIRRKTKRNAAVQSGLVDLGAVIYNISLGKIFMPKSS